MKNILYSYALDPTGRLVHISNVTKDNRHIYSCVQCGAPMLPKLGDIRQHHFCHLAGSGCDGESYLHRLAKLLLKKKFDETDSFPIEMIRLTKCSNAGECPFHNENACVRTDYISYNLKQYYDTCLEEQRVGGYIADLLLTDSSGIIGVPVLIEILVTHKCSDEKRNSGLKIIEMPVTSESDITIPIREGNVSLFGFQRGPSGCTPMSMRNIRRFILYENGKIYCEEQTCEHLNRKMKSHSALELNIDPGSTDVSPFQIGLVKALDMGHDIRSCYICRHANLRKGALSCRMSIVRNTPSDPPQTQARTCPYYTVDTELLAAVHEMSESMPVSVVY